MSFLTPALPYAYDALEPYIDSKTMEVHHDKHHEGYTGKLNKALEGSDLAGRSIEDLLKGLNDLPESIRTAVRNAGGGHFNHNLFWEILSPKGGGEPKGSLGEAIKKDFGSFASFADSFSRKGAGLFGSGWVWLVKDGSSGLSIVTTANQDNPLSSGSAPVLGLDLWEHAYYLKYQNRRAEYIGNFFKLINWEKAEENFIS
jgi:superoxide dismutase, Fe-Mn family